MSWSWPLFGWGAAAGPIWIAVTTAAFRLSARYVRGDAAATSSKFAAYYPLWASIGLPVGVLSAVFSTQWPDAVFTAYAVLSLLVPLVMLPKLRRAAKECSTGGACTTCPIACDRRIATG